MTLAPPVPISIKIWHEDVSGGVADIFLLYQEEDKEDPKSKLTLGENVSVEIEIDYSIGQPQMTKVIYATLQAWNTNTIDGKVIDREATIAKLLEYISKGTNIAFLTETAAYAGLVADGHTLTLVEYDRITIASLRLRKDGFNVVPAEPGFFLETIWQDDGTNQKIKWNANDQDPKLSYWR